MSKLLRGGMTHFSFNLLEEHCFVWKVDNFASIRKSKESLMKTEFNFSMGNQIGVPTEWSVKLNRSIDQEVVGMYLRLTCKPKDLNEINIRYRFQILQMEGKEFSFDSKMSYVENFANEFNGKGYKMLKDDVSDDDLPLTHNGAIVFELQVILYSTSPKKEVALHFKNFRTKFTQKLQSDLEKMFSENKTCTASDSQTEIITDVDIKFLVNRGILSARSPVFMRMFQADMSEAKTGVVQIKDISSTAMKIILSFIYTGKLQESWADPSYVLELVYAAGKYELVDLLEFLDKAVGLVCTEENAGKLMNLARKLNMKKAVGDLHNFIRGHSSSFEMMEEYVKDAQLVDLFGESVVHVPKNDATLSESK